MSAAMVFKQSVHFRGTRIMTHGHRRFVVRRGLAWFAAILGLLLVSATSSRADVMTFAQFTQINVGDQNFVYSNNNTSADFSTISGGNPILLGIADSVRPTGLASSQDAHLFLSASTSRSPLPAAAPSMRPLSRNRQVFFLLAWRRLHLPVSVYGGNDCKLSEAARCRDVRLCTVGIIGRPVIHVIS